MGGTQSRRGCAEARFANTDLGSFLPVHALWLSPLWSGASDLLSHARRPCSSSHSDPSAPCATDYPLFCEPSKMHQAFSSPLLDDDDDKNTSVYR